MERLPVALEVVVEVEVVVARDQVGGLLVGIGPGVEALARQVADELVRAEVVGHERPVVVVGQDGVARHVERALRDRGARHIGPLVDVLPLPLIEQAGIGLGSDGGEAPARSEGRRQPVGVLEGVQ